MSIDKKCDSCALYNHEQRGCLRTRRPQAPEDSCSDYCSELPSCEVCGQFFLPPKNYIIENEKIMIVCGACLTGLSTCRTCANKNSCDFLTNPINIPPQIQQQVQQGPMVVIQTVMNPARIAETCEKGCPCWDNNEKICNKQTAGTCGIGYKPSYFP